jgi:hypothetical protein
MKFQSNDTINITIEPTLCNTDLMYKIIIGPIINHPLLCWTYYNARIDIDNLDRDSMIDRCQKYFTPIDVDTGLSYVTKYVNFKKYFKIDYVELIDNRLIEMTDNDLMDDLDLMKDILIRHQDRIDKYFQSNDMDNYNKCRHILNIEQHILFQIPTKEQYGNYLDKISETIDRFKSDEKKKMETIMIMSENLFDPDPTDDRTDDRVDDRADDRADNRADDPTDDRMDGDRLNM